MKPTYEELEARCAVLAAENENLVNFITDKHWLGSDCIPETPATDAFLAEVRKHDLNMFIKHINAELDAYISNGGDEFNAKACEYRHVLALALIFRSDLHRGEVL